MTNNVNGAPVDYALLIKDTEAVAMVSQIMVPCMIIAEKFNMVQDFTVFSNPFLTAKINKYHKIEMYTWLN